MDTFSNHTRSLTSPPEHAGAIQPDDAGTLAFVTRALYVGIGGDITVRMLDGGSATLVNVPGGTLLPLRVDQVLATGTTAGAILGLW